MRREAHHLQSAWWKDEWVDEYVYALLSHEWLARWSPQDGDPRRDHDRARSRARCDPRSFIEGSGIAAPLWCWSGGSSRSRRFGPLPSALRAGCRLSMVVLVSELFDAVEDELETSFELGRVVVAGCAELFDQFDEVGEPVGE
jgi:hypothetical protein